MQSKGGWGWLGEGAVSLLRSVVDLREIRCVLEWNSARDDKKGRRVLCIPLKPKYGLNGAPNVS
jgi:hypothetical protein